MKFIIGGNFIHIEEEIYDHPVFMPLKLLKSSVVIAYPADLNFHSLDKVASSFNLEIPYLCSC